MNIRSAAKYPLEGSGQREDEYGLYDYKARHYDPLLGRFTSPDTLIPEPGSPLAWDRYAYVKNNPVRFNDPTGHCIDGATTALCIAMAAGAIAGYALQVGENRAQGMDWGAALTTNISGEKILAGALIGGGVVLGAALASVGITAIGAAVGGACADGDCGNEIQLSAKLGQDVWKMNPFTRGGEIESTLGRSPNLAQNFPVIDRYNNGLATSIKSLDLGAKSYQNLTTLTRT
ncbi:hypothetical protein EG834_15470, partial [bacterium]|nr:hypothetical protein [bacterium]